MTCLANNETLFDLFDSAMLGLFARQTDPQTLHAATAASRFTLPTPLTAANLIPEPRATRLEDDPERWDGLS